RPAAGRYVDGLRAAAQRRHSGAGDRPPGDAVAAEPAGPQGRGGVGDAAGAGGGGVGGGGCAGGAGGGDADHVHGAAAAPYRGRSNSYWRVALNQLAEDQPRGRLAHARSKRATISPSSVICANSSTQRRM